MPTCETRLPLRKNSRSPGCLAAGATFGSAAAWAALVRGSRLPSWVLKMYVVKPEQSKALGPVEP
jgi:hypothetical protein